MKRQGAEGKAWYYDEYQHVGVDFESAAEAQAYDDEIGKGINQRDNCAEIVDALRLQKDDTVLEIGTATGRLAIDLAQMCEKVWAIDISQTMLAFAREKVQKLGRHNVEFTRAGFLTFQCEEGTLDAVITKFALHHLPDRWKFVAIKRVFDSLWPGGRLFLKDATISVDINDFFAAADYWVDSTRRESGDKPAEATALCIKEEYPTYAWILQGMLERVGFAVDSVRSQFGLHTTFVCTKPAWGEADIHD